MNNVPMLRKESPHPAPASGASLPTSVVMLDETARLTAVNPGWKDLLRHLQCTLPQDGVGMAWEQAAQALWQRSPAAVRALTDAVQQVQRGEAARPDLELQAQCPCGERWLLATVQPLCTEAQNAGAVSVVLIDISQRKQVTLELELAASVFTHARESIVITDAQGAIVDANAAFSKITGYTLSEVQGKNPRILQSGLQDAAFYATMWSTIRSAGHWSGEIWNRRKNGELYAQLLTISAISDRNGAVQNYVAMAYDITAQKQQQQQLERMAHFDALTGLPNRVLLSDRLDQALLQCERRATALCVVYLDLDGFKAVNDTHGHAMGDELLVTIARRMKATLREGDSLARFGGDEFVAVLTDLDRPHDCTPILERLLQACADPVVLPGPAGALTLTVSASIGATLYPLDGVDADLLLRHADQAMYAAKQSGKNRYHLHGVDQETAARNRNALLSEIRAGLDAGQFVLQFRPVVQWPDGQAVGATAQIHWQHPRRGLLRPDAFLPHIENHALGAALDAWALQGAVEQLQSWQAQGLTLWLGVGLGAAQLARKGFVTQLGQLVGRFKGSAPPPLVLELAESAMHHVQHYVRHLDRCKALGLRIAIKNLGAGLSSLGQLRDFPADLLKIDRSVVQGMVTDSGDMAMVRSVIGLAQAFQCEVIADGVASPAQSGLLHSLGCTLLQGDSLAPVMPADAFLQWLAQRTPTEQAAG